MSHNGQEIDIISLLRTYLFLPCFSFPRLSTFSKTASLNTAANYFGDIYIVRIQIADGSNELITFESTAGNDKTSSALEAKHNNKMINQLVQRSFLLKKPIKVLGIMINPLSKCTVSSLFTDEIHVFSFKNFVLLL